MQGPRNKLEMLLEQSDIFGYLARLNAGKVSIHSAFEKSKKNLYFRNDTTRKARLSNRADDDCYEGGICKQTKQYNNPPYTHGMGCVTFMTY